MATPSRQQPLPEQEQAYPGQTGEMDLRPRAMRWVTTKAGACWREHTR